MSASSKIQWTDATWNPTRGCSRVSEGCRNCYAERQAARFVRPGDPFHGFVADGKWTGKVELVRDKLAEPLSWRKPARVFVNSMSDLFHERLAFEDIAAVFGVMAHALDHTFQVLTKRPERMRWFFAEVEDRARRSAAVFGNDSHEWRANHVVRAAAIRNGVTFKNDARNLGLWPLLNVWLGVSVEDQAAADERIPHLLATPAAVRFVSYEPALGPVDFGYTFSRAYVASGGCPALDWLIVGGESGPGARPCDVAWLRSAVAQCKAAGVPVFVKQLGARPCDLRIAVLDGIDEMRPEHLNACGRKRLRDRKGGDPSEWPEDLRVREFPR